jgi:hypothetical protein
LVCLLESCSHCIVPVPVPVPVPVSI